MPSRKKAKGQARRARQNLKYGSPSCNHFNPSLSFTRKDDADQCRGLLIQCDEKCLILNGMIYDEAVASKMSKILTDIYCNYCELTASQRVLFRKMALSLASRHILQKLSKESFTDFISKPAYSHVVHLFVIIEVHDRRGGLSQVGAIEIERIFNGIQCPRDFVRFVHERNSCSCLESAYIELKRTTQRSYPCWHCKRHIPIKQIKVCSNLLVIVLGSVNYRITQSTRRHV
jgi:hypothetical protein